MPMTAMERHAKLGPIAWTDGGMRATTSDGYVVEIVPSDIGPLWTVRIDDPPNPDGQQWRGVAKVCDPRAARVLVADYIGYERYHAAQRAEAINVAWAWYARVADRVAPGGLR